MGIVIKQSIRSSLLAYIGFTIGAINFLFIFPKFLSVEQVGLLRVIPSAAFLMATFAQLGLAPSIIKFLPRYKTGSIQRKEFLGFSIITAMVGYLLLLVVTYIFKEELLSYYAQKSPLFVAYFQVSLIIALFLLFIQMAEAYSRSLLKSIAPVFIRDVVLRLMTTITVLLYGFGFIEFQNFINLFVLLYGVTLLSHIGYFIYLKAFKIRFRFNHLKKVEVKKVLKYGLFTLIGASGTQIVLQIDSLMVAGIKGLDATGIYTIAFFIGTIIEIPKRSITQITTPLMARAFQKGDMNEVANYYKQTSINQLVIGSLLLLGVWANLDSIYAIMPNSEVYQSGFNVVLIIGLGKLVDMLFGVNGEIIVLSKYYKFNVATVAFLAIAIVIGNLLLIPTYGIEGAAASSLAAMVLFNLIKFVFVYVKFGIQPFSVNTLKFIVVIAIVVLLNLILPRNENILIDVLLRSFVITLVLIVPTYLLGISKEINGILNKLIKRKNEV